MRKIFSSLALVCLLGLRASSAEPEQLFEWSSSDQERYFEFQLEVEDLWEDDEPPAEIPAEEALLPLMLYDLNKVHLNGVGLKFPGKTLGQFGPTKKKMYAQFILGWHKPGEKQLPASRCQIETGYDQTVWFGGGDKKCIACTTSPERHGYDPSESYQPKRFGSTFYPIGYNYYFNGSHYADRLSLYPMTQYKIPSFHFYLAESRKTAATFSIDADCVLGLAQRHRQHDDFLFISQMKAAGLIGKRQFSISYWPHDPTLSRILHGGFNLNSYAKPGHQFTYHEVYPLMGVWSLDLGKFGIANNKMTIENQAAKKRLIQFDTQIDGFHVSHSYKEPVEALLKKATGLAVDLLSPSNWYHCPEPAWTSFPDFFFEIDGHRYWISRDILFIRSQAKYCKLNMHTTNYDEWVVGLSWIQQFYTVFDNDNKKIGFVPAKKAPALAHL